MKSSIRRIEVERAENGFTARHYHEEGPGMSYRSPTTHVFKDHNLLAAHVSKAFKGKNAKQEKSLRSHK